MQMTDEKRSKLRKAIGLALVILLQILFFILFYKYFGEKKLFSKRMLLALLLTGAALFVAFFRKNTGPARMVAFSVFADVLILFVIGSGLFKKSFTMEDPVSVLWISGMIAAWLFMLGLSVFQRKDEKLRILAGCVWITGFELVFRMTILLIGMDKSLSETAKALFMYPSKAAGVLSLMIAWGLYLCLAGILGAGTGMLVWMLFWIVLLCANCVRMHYHDSFFKVADLYLIKDFFRILPSFVRPLYLLILALVIGLIVCFVIKCRSWLKNQLQIRPCSVSAVAGLLLLIYVFSGLYGNVYTTAKIDKTDAWTQDPKKVSIQGYPAFLYFSYLRIKDLIPRQPEGYGPEMIEGVLAKETGATGTDSSEIADGQTGEQPDIIFLMLESVVDADIFESYGVTLSENPDPFLDEVASSATVSPTRGGLTARAEFEALTGLSDAWYPEGTVEYTTFFGGNPRHIYSVVEAAQKHGYTVKAIHQNIETFFNRNIVYESMGFDDFITQEDYEVNKEDLNEDNFMKCDHLLGQLEEELEKETPTMLWSITIETHGPYAGKYTDTKIHASSDLLSKEETAELEGYLQGVYNTDEMLSQLSDYLKERNRPSILVTFGDHWPGLNAMNSLGVGADNPLITFDTVCAGLYYPGNGKEYEKLPMPERLSMNYLPIYLLHAAGINDEPFYEYLTGLQQKEPVFQTSYLDQDRINSYEDYKTLQYDILFGEGYAGE